jgi:hypothetical protein
MAQKAGFLLAQLSVIAGIGLGYLALADAREWPPFEKSAFVQIVAPDDNFDVPEKRISFELNGKLSEPDNEHVWLAILDEAKNGTFSARCSTSTIAKLGGRLSARNNWGQQVP